VSRERRGAEGGRRARVVIQRPSDRDLRERVGAHVVAMAVGGVPFGGPGDGGVEIEPRMPAQRRHGLRGGEAKDRGLAIFGRAGRLPARVVVEAGDEAVDDVDGGAGGGVGGCKIEAGRRLGRVVGQALDVAEIAGQRVQHMLPGADGGGVAQHRRLARPERAHEIGDQAVGRPVAAADDVAGAGAAEADAPGGIGGAIGVDRELGRRLGGAVGSLPPSGSASRRRGRSPGRRRPCRW
jgi:hypothetical protein